MKRGQSTIFDCTIKWLQLKYNVFSCLKTMGYSLLTPFKKVLSWNKCLTLFLSVELKKKMQGSAVSTSKQHSFKMKAETGIQVSKDQDIIFGSYVLGARDMSHVLNDSQMNLLFILRRLHIAISNKAHIHFSISLMKQTCDNNKLKPCLFLSINISHIYTSYRCVMHLHVHMIEKKRYFAIICRAILYLHFTQINTAVLM